MIFVVLIAIIIATIILSIVLERFIKSPTLVALIIFSIALIVIAILFAVGVIAEFATALLGIIALTVIAFLVVWFARFIRCICRNYLGECCNNCPNNIGNNDNCLNCENGSDNDCECNRSVGSSFNDSRNAIEVESREIEPEVVVPRQSIMQRRLINRNYLRR